MPRFGIRLPHLGIRHGREIFALAVPTMLTMMSHTVMWTVSTAFLGHVSSLALAAAGLGGMITWTAYCLFNNLSRVTTTFISQANGEGNDAAVGDFTWQGIYVALASGILLTVAGQWSHVVLRLTGNPPDIMEATSTYIRIRTWSAVATQLALCTSGFFQGRKDVKTPMWAGTVSNLVNIPLDYFFIFGSGALGIPAMGLRGAAIAVNLSTTLNALILVVCLFWPRAYRLRYRIHQPRRPSWLRIRDLARVGLPSSVDTFLDMLCFSVFSTFIGRSGAAALAASQITIQLLSFSFMPMWGLTTAATVLVGNHIGEKRTDRAETYAVEMLRLGLYYTLGLALLLALLGRPIFRIFTGDAEVLVFAGSLALLAAIFQFFDGMRMIAVGILQGAGDTRFPMWLTAGVLCGLFVPASYWMVVVRGGGVAGAWAVGALVYLLMAAGLYARFRAGHWKRIRIFSEG